MLVGQVAMGIRVFCMAVCGAGTTFFVAVILYLLPPAGLTSPTAPLVLSCVVGLVVGEVMMHPLSSAARAALHCFILDEEQTSARGADMCQTRPAGVLVYVRQSRGEAVELG